MWEHKSILFQKHVLLKGFQSGPSQASDAVL